jgi:hypothetical protein
MKIVTTQNGRNHSDFYPGMAVIAFELRLLAATLPQD